MPLPTPPQGGRWGHWVAWVRIRCEITDTPYQTMQQFTNTCIRQGLLRARPESCFVSCCLWVGARVHMCIRHACVRARSLLGSDKIWLKLEAAHLNLHFRPTSLPRFPFEVR